MFAATRIRTHRRTGRNVVGAAWAVLLGFTYLAGIAGAMHEVDHRFTVEGYVCGPDKRPVSDAKVIVKDTRVSVGTAVFTDASGYYKATLHLHNDNLGDPILVAALEQEQTTKAQFDPKNVKDERHVVVNIGSGCEGAEGGSPVWVYYGAGVGLAAGAVAIGARLMRKGQQPEKRGKGKRK
jgi:hypothetical protein